MKKRIEVIRSKGQIIDYKINDDSMEWDIYDVQKKSVNISMIQNSSVEDIYHFQKDDYLVLSDFYFLGDSQNIDVPYAAGISVHRRDEEFYLNIYIDNGTVVDEIKGHSVPQVFKYVEIIAKTKEFFEVVIPFEFEDSVHFGLRIHSELRNSTKEFVEYSIKVMNDLIHETITHFDKLDKAIRSNKFIVNLDEEIITPISQYLLFFREYILKSKNENISIDINRIEKGIQISFPESNSIKISLIKEWMMEYLSHVNNKTSEFQVNYETEKSENSKKLLQLSLKQEVSSLENRMEIVKMENGLLKENNEYLKLILQNLSNQPTQVTTFIKNDTYNFIDKAISESKHLSNSDREILKLIDQNVPDEEGKIELVKSLKELRNPNSDSKSKAKAKSLFGKFMESGISEAAKQLVKRLIETGLENLPL